jgi:hypothetical protein
MIAKALNSVSKGFASPRIDSLHHLLINNNNYNYPTFTPLIKIKF